MTDLNCRPPRCKRDALPAELIAPLDIILEFNVVVVNKNSDTSNSYGIAECALWSCINFSLAATLYKGILSLAFFDMFNNFE